MLFKEILMRVKRTTKIQIIAIKIQEMKRVPFKRKYGRKRVNWIVKKIGRIKWGKSIVMISQDINTNNIPHHWKYPIVKIHFSIFLQVSGTKVNGVMSKQCYDFWRSCQSITLWHDVEMRPRYLKITWRWECLGNGRFSIAHFSYYCYNPSISMF